MQLCIYKEKTKNNKYHEMKTKNLNLSFMESNEHILFSFFTFFRGSGWLGSDSRSFAVSEN